MKRKFVKMALLLTSLFAFQACLPSQNATITNDDKSDDTVSISTDDSGGSSSGGSTTNSCSGTTSDGSGAGFPIHQFNLFLSGHQAWIPGTYSNSLATMTMPTIEEAGIIFKSDTRLKIRFKVQSQPYPTVGQEYCYGRATNQASDAHNYTKLRFRVHLRDVQCANPDPSDSSKCLSSFYLGARYRTQMIDPVAVDSCSPTLDLGSQRNITQYGTVVEVEDVKADSTCQYNDTFCPAEKIVRAASCWRMTMQVVTDYTQDFN